ncbi:MAG: hypothetical protein ACRDJ5_09320 [Actinomycetota bacterium]
MPAPELEEGWYLMSTSDLERELARLRSGDPLPPSNARRLSTEEALAYRNAGNVPDEEGRTLRLVLRIDDVDMLDAIEERRRAFEPDFHDAPRWRRPGSAPVNVVTLRGPEVAARKATPWFEQPDLASLEQEWRATGAVAGLRVPADYRGFVYKTILALRASGKEVSPDTIADSIARWMAPGEAEEIRRALVEANRPGR